MQETGFRYDEADDKARELIRHTGRATRRRFTLEEKVKIVLEGIRGGMPISVLCRREGLDASTYYKLLKEFMEAGKERLARTLVPTDGKQRYRCQSCESVCRTQRNTMLTYVTKY